MDQSRLKPHHSTETAKFGVLQGFLQGIWVKVFANIILDSTVSAKPDKTQQRKHVGKCKEL